MFKTLILAITLLLIPILLFSQEWGEISKEELNMETLAEDPEANAAIIFNKAEIKITPKFDMEMTVHKRIKILTEIGKEYADVKITYWHEDKIFNIQASSYNTEGNESELDDDDIYEEKTKYSRSKLFAIPGVKVGSVIEFKYKIYSKYISNLEPWYFQEKEFTKYSEVVVYLPKGFAFNTLKMNSDYSFIERKEKTVLNPFDFRKKVRKVTWHVADVPGIKKEPYMTAFDDYYARILFQLVSYKDAYTNYTFAKTWNDIITYVRNKYNPLISQNKGLKDLAVKLTKDVDNVEQKIEILYDYVCREFKTTENTGLYGKDLKQPIDVFKTKSGSVNEKNLLLINLLNHSGIKAKPLMISKKSNGKIYPMWVQLEQFNRVIVYLKNGSKSIFMNSGSRSCPVGLLTPEYAVDKGLLIDNNSAKIINIELKKLRNKLEIKTDIILDNTGNLAAQSHIIYEGINAVLERDKLYDKNLREYLENKLKEVSVSAKLDTFFYSQIDSVNKPLSLDITYTIPDYFTQMGSINYFSVPFFTRLGKNPFVREKRSFPVDFFKKNRITEIVKIHIPDSYVIDEKPIPEKVKMNKFSFNKIYFTKDNEIECRRSYSLNRTIFKPKEYATLRKMYEKIVNSDQDQIVIVRKGK